jgi:virginiamycin B lyase
MRQFNTSSANTSFATPFLVLLLAAPACGDEANTAPVTETSAALASQAPENDRGDDPPRACGQIDEFTVPPGPQGNISPQEIVAGGDGGLWFATFAPFLGRVSPRDGAVSLVPIPISTGRILAAGPDGNLWFGTNTGLAVVAARGDHTLREIPVPGLGSVIDLAAGPDRAMWVLGFGNIARVTLSGGVTLFPIPNPSGTSSSEHMAIDRKGNIWYSSGSQIHRMTATGAVTDFPVDGTGLVYALALGPDGAIWFTQQGGAPGANRIGRIAGDGVVSTVVQLPDSDAPAGSAPTNMPLELTLGRDENMYFTTYLVNPLNYVGRVTRRGELTTFDIPTGGAASFGITAGPDGNIWFTENFNSLIGRLDIAACHGRAGRHHRR